MCYVAGLDTDGIYRVSGNLSVIQKLRFLVNHGKCVEQEGVWGGGGQPTRLCDMQSSDVTHPPVSCSVGINAIFVHSEYQ